MKNKKGFTIIEMIVVIFIIGLMITIATVKIREAKQKSRDSRRSYDIQQYAKALTIYEQENKKYPSGSDCGGSTCSNYLGRDNGLNTTISSYYPGLPSDPGDNGGTTADDYYYYYNESNSQCDGYPTVAVQNMETEDSDFNFNPCGSDLADYLIILR